MTLCTMDIAIYYDDKPFRCYFFVNKIVDYIINHNSKLSLKVYNFDVYTKNMICAFRFPDKIIYDLKTTYSDLNIQAYTMYIKKLQIHLKSSFIMKTILNNTIEYIPYYCTNMPSFEIEYSLKGVTSKFQLAYHTNVHAMIAMSRSDYEILQSMLNTRKSDSHEIVSLKANNFTDYFVPDYILSDLKSNSKNEVYFASEMARLCSEPTSDMVWVYNMELSQYSSNSEPKPMLVGGKLQFTIRNDIICLEYHLQTLLREICEEWLIRLDEFNLIFHTWFNTSNELVGVFRICIIKK